jgi:hypothetical protein
MHSTIAHSRTQFACRRFASVAGSSAYAAGIIREKSMASLRRNRTSSSSSEQPSVDLPAKVQVGVAAVNSSDQPFTVEFEDFKVAAGKYFLNAKNASNPQSGSGSFLANGVYGTYDSP